MDWCYLNGDLPVAKGSDNEHDDQEEGKEAHDETDDQRHLRLGICV